MHSAAASMWALTKFSYSSFGVYDSGLSCRISNLFVNVNAYLSLICLLFGRDHSLYTVVIVRVVFAFVGSVVSLP